jgi:hypothetical protein
MIKITQVCPELFCAKNRSTFFASSFYPLFHRTKIAPPTRHKCKRSFLFGGLQWFYFLASIMGSSVSSLFSRVLGGRRDVRVMMGSSPILPTRSQSPGTWYFTPQRPYFSFLRAFAAKSNGFFQFFPAFSNRFKSRQTP